MYLGSCGYSSWLSLEVKLLAMPLLWKLYPFYSSSFITGATLISWICFHNTRTNHNGKVKYTFIDTKIYHNMTIRFSEGQTLPLITCGYPRAEFGKQYLPIKFTLLHIRRPAKVYLEGLIRSIYVVPCALTFTLTHPLSWTLKL